MSTASIRKILLIAAVLGAAGLMSGCVYEPAYPSYAAAYPDYPGYYNYPYYGPSVGLGFGFGDRDDWHEHHHWHHWH